MGDNLSFLLNNLYLDIHHSKYAELKYKIGLFNTFKYDELIRKKFSSIFKPLLEITKVGNVTFGNHYYSILEYLNIDNHIWFNPETNEKYCTSFDDLWNKSINEVLETIDDINKYLYQDKPLKNYYIDNDISYNTGLPCNKGQTIKYSKKY